MGIKTAVFIIQSAKDKLWIPNKNIPVFYYKRNRRFSYLMPDLPRNTDFLGLKKLFEKLDRDVIHAHNLECAWYSYNLGLPTVFDDWEYFLEYYDFKPDPNARFSSFPLRLIRNHRAKTILKKMIRKIPAIVTNKNVKEKYEQLGARKIFVVPNVPLTFEREYAFENPIIKQPKQITGYVGNMIRDNRSEMRNTKGLTDFWKENNLGELYIFQGKNYCDHLDIMRKLREFHFNLLYWKPLKIHRYYLQNKPFLASVVGVPTIISSSLTATTDLLGEYAIPVQKMEEIPAAIEKAKNHTDLPLDPKHLWEFYEPEIKKAYQEFK